MNDLSGSDWLRFTKSWFVTHPPRRSAAERAHPAKFPEELCEAFVRFFTRRGMWVLDPFAGTGSTLVAAVAQQRNAVGIDLNPVFVRVANERVRAAGGTAEMSVRILQADARDLSKVWAAEHLPTVQLVLTSPPYWDMLYKSRGGSRSAHRDRRAGGLATTYSTDPRDLGNLHDYSDFLATTAGVLRATSGVLDPGRYLVVVAQNLRDVDGRVRTLAWDLVRELDRPPFQFQGERIWCQDSKPLGIWGFPSTFVPNYHHHYCLIFRRTDAEPAARDYSGAGFGTSVDSSVSIRSATSR